MSAVIGWITGSPYFSVAQTPTREDGAGHPNTDTPPGEKRPGLPRGVED